MKNFEVHFISKFKKIFDFNYYKINEKKTIMSALSSFLYKTYTYMLIVCSCSTLLEITTYTFTKNEVLIGLVSKNFDTMLTTFLCNQVSCRTIKQK